MNSFCAHWRLNAFSASKEHSSPGHKQSAHQICEFNVALTHLTVLDQLTNEATVGMFVGFESPLKSTAVHVVRALTRTAQMTKLCSTSAASFIRIYGRRLAV